MRFKSMAESAGTSVEDDGSSAHALTGSYMRLREQVGNLLDNDLSDEFNEAFPTIEVIEPPQIHPGAAARAQVSRTPQARTAHLLLGQLAGCWLDGLIAESTLERRLRYEAEERVKREFAAGE